MRERVTSANPASASRDHLQYNPLSRRAFMKRTGAASVAALLVNQALTPDANATGAGSSAATYKIWREVTYTDGLPGNYIGRGEGTSMNIARAKAFANLIKKLKDANRMTVTSDITCMGTMESGLSLIAFEKVVTGTPASHHLGLVSNANCAPLSENPDYTLPEDEDGLVLCEVMAHLVGASGVIRYEWTWGKKVNGVYVPSTPSSTWEINSPADPDDPIGDPPEE